MTNKVGHGGSGPWNRPKSGEVPSPASRAAAEQPKLAPPPPKLAPKRPATGPTHGISKRMPWGG